MELHDIITAFVYTAQAAEAAGEAAGSPDVIGMLGINLKLFIAQLINFGIVLFVLWRWVFTPVAKSLQARTERIERSLQDATAVETAKQEFEAWRSQALAEAKAESAAIITQAKTNAEQVRAELLAQAKVEQEALAAKGLAQLQAEKLSVIADIKQEVAHLVTEAAAKVIGKKLDSEADRKLVEESVAALKK